MECLESRERLRDGAQVCGRADDVEVARERQAQVAERREGEEGAHEVQQARVCDSIGDEFDTLVDAADWGRDVAGRRGYGEARDGGVSGGEGVENVCGDARELGGGVAVLPACHGERVHRWEADDGEKHSQVCPYASYDECGDGFECK